MARTHYATDEQEATADRLIEDARSAVEGMPSGSWGPVKTAVVGLVYNDMDRVARGIVRALQRGRPDTIFVDDRVLYGLTAVQGNWIHRTTPGQIVKAIKELRDSGARRNPRRQRRSASRMRRY